MPAPRCGGSLGAYPTNLPNTAALVTLANKQESLPSPTVPKSGAIPAQESGDRPAQALGYAFSTTTATNTATKQLVFTTTNVGTLAGAFTAYTVNHATFQATPYTCAVGGSISAGFSTTAGNGAYDIDLHGPDGYLRGFQGNVTTWSNTSAAHPEASVVDGTDGVTLTLTLSNAGSVSAVFTVQPNAAYLAPSGTPTTITVAAGATTTTTLSATTAGRYDFTVTANTGDGFARRFAGRLYAH